MSAPIVLDKLTRYYGETPGAVDLTFEVEEGEIFGFLGPNGAGKTTTIRLLLGFMKPTSGSARIYGRDCWGDQVAVKRMVGFLPSEAAYYGQLTARETFEFLGAFRDAPEMTRRVNEFAERLELNIDRPVRQLSSGNRQKVGIIQALMHDPPLLILDEPTSGLDPLKQNEFLDILEEERRRGRTIFLSSHQLPEVERVATRVAVIRQGELVAVEDIETLKARRQRQMTVTLSEPASLEGLRSLQGVEVVSPDGDGQRLELAISGPLQPVLRALGELPVVDLVYGPPDLESIFIAYYGEEKASLKEEERVEV